MNHLPAVIDHVVFGPKGRRQLIVGIQRAPVLAEGDHPQVHRPLDGSRIGFQGPRHQPQQRRLAGTIGAQQTNPLTGREDQIQVVEERLAPHRLGDRMQRQQTFGFSFGGFEINLGGFVFCLIASGGGLEVRLAVFGVFHRVLAAGRAGLDALPQPSSVPTDFVGQGRLFGGLGVQEFFFAAQELGVVAFDFEGAPGIDRRQFDDAFGGLFEEGPVVGDEDHRTLRSAHPLLQPLHPFQVEVVGGFIQEQQVRFSGDPRRQGHPLPPAPREHTKRGFLHRLSKAQLRERNTSPVFGVGAVRGIVVGHGRTDDLDGRRLHGVVVHLTDVDGSGAARHEDLSRVRLIQPGKHFQQGGLARPVGADQPDSVSNLDMNRHIREKRAGRKGFFKMAGGEKRGHEA